MSPATHSASKAVTTAGRYLTVDETADLLRTTPKAIRRLIEKGLLAHAVRRIGRRVLIAEHVLVASIESGGLSAGGARR